VTSKKTAIQKHHTEGGGGRRAPETPLQNAIRLFGQTLECS
jgi:hypothetical protein